MYAVSNFSSYNIEHICNNSSVFDSIVFRPFFQYLSKILKELIVQLLL